MKSRRTGALYGLASLAMLSFAFVSGPSARAQPAASFSGRSINLLIGYSVGGGYDLTARLVAKYMGRHIPGAPYLLPQNMPGAGSLKAINYLLSVAPKDGSAFGTFGRSLAVEPLLGGPSFDARKLTWLGSVTSDVSVCITWSTSPIKTVQDLLTKKGTFGGQGAGSDSDTFTTTVRNLFNPQVKLVTGYPGSNEAALAMERGEVDGECGVSWSSIKVAHPEWLRDGKVHVLLQMALTKHPDLPDVPLLTDFVHDDRTRSVLKVILAGQTFARPFAAPPGLSPETAATLRKAFDDTMHDPDFVAEAGRLGLEVRPVSWQEIDALLAELYATPSDILAKAKEIEGVAK